MKLYVLSYSKVKCQVIKALNKRAEEIQIHETYIRPLKVEDMYHGQNITVSGIEMIFVFDRLEQKNCQLYKITVCNEFGNRSYTVNLVSTGKLDDSHYQISH